jgi:hypothetical protein
MRTVEALILAARFIISGTLLISAVTHFLAPLAFLESVYSYQIVGGSAGWLIALALPAIALSVSLGLLDNQLARHALKAAILLFAAFLSAQLVVLYRGLSIDCGCFGPYGQTVGIASVSFTAVLFSLSVMTTRIDGLTKVSESATA